MAKLSIKAGSTSVLCDILVLDSSSTTGAGLTNKTFSDFTAYYHRSNSSSATAMSLASMTAGTWTSNGLIKIDDTNMPGMYQVGLPDAALATGAQSVTVMYKGTGMVPTVLEIQLTGVSVANIESNVITATSIQDGAFTGAKFAAGGTMQSGSTGTTAVLATSESATDDVYNYELLKISGGTGAGQCALITDYTGATRTAAIYCQQGTAGAWKTTPDNTSTYDIVPFIDVLRVIVETQGSITAQQALSVILSAAAGEWTAAGTFKSPNGVSTRIAGTASSSAPFRSTITLTPSS
jgi:hypothetical protein